MNNILYEPFITHQNIAIIPVLCVTLDLIMTSNVSKLILASSYGFLTILCSAIYCNNDKT